MLRLLLRLIVMLMAAAEMPAAAAAEPIAPVLKVAQGFSVEPVYVVPRDSQGSWISLSADSRGLLYASDQYGPLYQISIGADRQTTDHQTTARPLQLPIGGIHGMTWLGDELYAVVGQREVCQPGLYRLRDTDSDRQLDTVEQLRALGGDGEHGPHAVVPSTDGHSLFVIAGNAAPLPPLVRSRVPLWRDDSLLPPLPALIGSETRGLPHGGWICRTDREGRDWELVCMGFRNAYAVARDASDELFTFDSDTEFEIGLPWYRPTRVLHGLSGADFGWRRGALKVPENAPDTLSPVLSLGLGSPTEILFATGAAFPARYRQALFVADWTFGRLLAVHLQPHGASFKANSEEIVAGTPLPITAACINPQDGAVYFVTGGRKTQSVLYRLTWQGPDQAAAAQPQDSSDVTSEQRRALERFHGQQNPAAVDTAWPFLGHDDPTIRHAARIAIESQPLSSWQQRALTERQPRAALTALLALARAGDSMVQAKVLESLAAMNWQHLGSSRSDWLRVAWLAFSRLGQPPPELRQRWIELLSPYFPSDDRALDGPLCELLVFLEAPDIARKAVSQLTDENSRERQLHFGRCLSTLSTGWTPELRNAYFDWLSRASTWRGGASFPAFLQRFRADALAHVPENERGRFQQRLKITTSSDSVPQRPLIKHWTLDELVTLAERSPSDGNATRGRKSFLAARCALCHTFAGDGGAVGMDLTAVARRLSIRELLEAIIDPSKEISDQYGSVIVTRRDGSQVSGRVVNFAGGAIHISTDLFDPSSVLKVPEADVESITRSKVSLMPAGLLDVLQADEILDLLAYLKSESPKP